MDFKLEPTISLELPKHKGIHFFVIGAGGTGGHLLPNLIRQIGVLNEEIDENYAKHSITVVDSDEVEDKNLRRQNFTSHDLGKNKAEVMAKRYGRAFGVSVGFIPEYVTTPEDFVIKLNESTAKQRQESILFTRDDGSIIGTNRQLNFSIVVIDCTDNNKTRLIMREGIRQLNEVQDSIYLLSSGNEEKTGQVSFGAFYSDSGASSSIGRLLTRLEERHIYFFNTTDLHTPSFFDIFPNTKLDKLPTELSCAEAAISAPQNIGANITAANILFDFCNRLMAYEPISQFLVFFDIDSMARSVYRLCKTDLEKAFNFVDNSYSKRIFDVGEIDTEREVVKAPTWEDVEAEQAEVEAQEETTDNSLEDFNELLASLLEN